MREPCQSSHRSFAAFFATIALVASWCSSAGAQVARPATPEMTESCPGLVAGVVPRAIPPAYRLAALNSDQVRTTYLGHSTFLIESPQRVRITTDHNDFVRAPVVPDIATMNHAHNTHYTDHPEPGIKHVLRGWTPDGSPAWHDLQVQDVRVRNVPTNIRDWAGGTERYGNSIFIFEIANLCIVHLGHLHHTLTQQQLDEIGWPDVVFVPVDGSMTLDLEGMMEVLQSLKAQVMVPMHSFSMFTLRRFLDRAAQLWDVEMAEVPSFVISKTTLPAKPKVLVLPGQ